MCLFPATQDFAWGDSTQMDEVEEDEGVLGGSGVQEGGRATGAAGQLAGLARYRIHSKEEELLVGHVGRTWGRMGSRVLALLSKQ